MIADLHAWSFILVHAHGSAAYFTLRECGTRQHLAVGEGDMRRDVIQRFEPSRQAYERWLSERLGSALQRKDLQIKHEKMRESPFVFLRATYWRWAETILAICSELADAPMVTAVGDIHLENYGVWRDVDARLVWGVNDFDEAADMPYALDLVRLATSAILWQPAKRWDRKRICADILSGYHRGLVKPRPFILDERHMWLRLLFDVAERERRGFWKKMDALPDSRSIPPRYRQSIEAQMPGSDAELQKFARRTAGTGSLGRPRWVGVARWRGGRVVREAKALAPSAWTLAHKQRSRAHVGALLASGRYRAPDPWYDVRADVVVRRLSPNARKIEVKDHGRELDSPDMLAAMGHELANVHLGMRDTGKAIQADLRKRGGKWLRRSAETAAKFVTADFEEWRRMSRRQ
jgi:Uncharacterized protein conserved in bacteria (DUF2252)